MKNLLQILLSMFELFFIYLHTYNFSRLKYILIFFSNLARITNLIQEIIYIINMKCFGLLFGDFSFFFFFFWLFIFQIENDKEKKVGFIS